MMERTIYDIEIGVQKAVLAKALSRLQTQRSREQALTDIVNESAADVIEPENRQRIFDLAKASFAGTLPAPFSKQLSNLYEAVAGYLFDDLVVVQTDKNVYGLMPRRIARPADEQETATVNQYLELYSTMIAFDKVLRSYEEHMRKLHEQKESAEKEAKGAREQLREQWNLSRTGAMSRADYEASKKGLTASINKVDLMSISEKSKKYCSEHPELLQAYDNLLEKVLELDLDHHLNLSLPKTATPARVSYDVTELRAEIVPYSVVFKPVEKKQDS